MSVPVTRIHPTCVKEIVFIQKKTCLHRSIRTHEFLHLIRPATHVGLSGPLRKPGTDTAEAALGQTLRQVVVISKEGVITLDLQDPMKSSQINTGAPEVNVMKPKQKWRKTENKSLKTYSKRLKTMAERLM